MTSLKKFQSNFFSKIYILTLLLLISITFSFKTFKFLTKIKSLFTKDFSDLPSLRVSIDGKKLGELECLIISKLISDKEFDIEKNFSFQYQIPFLGNISMNIYNISLNFPYLSNQSVSLTFEDDSYLILLLDLFKASIKFKYNFKSNFLSTQGDAIANILNASMLLRNNISTIPNLIEPSKKGPLVQIQNLTVNMEYLKFNFTKEGTIEKFILYFRQNFIDIFNGLIYEKIKEHKLINKVNEILIYICQHIELNIPLTISELLPMNDTKISYSLNDKPFIKNKVLEVSFDSELLAKDYKYKNKNEIVLPHLVNRTDLTLINGYLSEFIFNNVLDFLYFYKKLDFDVKSEDTNPMNLTVQIMSYFINNLDKYYDKDDKVDLDIKTLEEHSLKINNTSNYSSYPNIIVKLKENIKVIIRNESRYQNSFDIIMNPNPIALDGNLTINLNIYFNISNLNIQANILDVVINKFDVGYCIIKNFDTEKFIQNFNFYKTFIISYINLKLQSYISELPIPKIPGISLNKTSIHPKNGYLDIEMTPEINASYLDNLINKLK